MHLEYAVVLIMASILNGYKLNAARRDLMRNIISLTFTKDNITFKCNKEVSEVDCKLYEPNSINCSVSDTKGTHIQLTCNAADVPPAIIFGNNPNLICDNDQNSELTLNRSCYLEYTLFKNRILQTDIYKLTLYKDQYTVSRRHQPMLQLECSSGKELCNSAPDKAECYNRGGIYNNIKWECFATLPIKIQFDSLTVSCEGYDNYVDRYVLIGSCRLKYTLVRQKEPFRMSTVYFSIFGSVFAFIILIITFQRLCGCEPHYYSGRGYYFRGEYYSSGRYDTDHCNFNTVSYSAEGNNNNHTSTYVASGYAKTENI